MSPLLSQFVFCLGAACLLRALYLSTLPLPTIRPRPGRVSAVRLAAFLLLPSLAHAAAADLRTAAESGNAIIMYLSATFAAVGIVAAGVAMMMGRQSIAKWAFAGAVVSGLAFAIVKTIWTSMGLEASGIGSF